MKKNRMMNYHCPKCRKKIDYNPGYKNRCSKCGWTGRVCRACGKEKILKSLYKTKINKKGKLIKGAIPRIVYECKFCKMEKKKEAEKNKKWRR